MQAKTLTLQIPLTSGVGLNGCADRYIFIKLGTKIYLAGFCYDLNDIQGELWDLCFLIDMFL